MSFENAEIVRAIYAAFNAGDLDALLAFGDPDIEWIPADGSPFKTAYHGRKQVKQFFEQEWRGSFDDLHSDVRQLVDGPDDVVVALLHLTGRGAVSGAELAIDIAHLWRLRNGVVVQGRAFTQAEKALEAAGLRRPTTT